MMEEVGFVECSYKNMTDGIVAIHSGFKFEWFTSSSIY
jgi:ubiquinone/menaquinone biosynthesis C-methylase UbiE